MNNDTIGAFIAGIGFALSLVGIFQVGINIGLKTCIKMLDGEYPAAMKYLQKANVKQVANVLPYVIGGNE